MKPLDYYAAISQMKWLEGTWQGKNGNIVYYETWLQSNDTLLCNDIFTFSDGNKVLTTHNQIEVIDGKIYYTRDPEGSNQKILWELADVDKRKIRFENEDAPYSQNIVFEQKTDQSWMATLTTDDKEVQYNLTKVPD